jgi:predicted regulator of Ras-like GTPase activity (Roadblock/LC7/MglB family)
MRRGDLGHFVDALREPVERFVRDTRVRLVLLVNRSGQVLAQHGFTRTLDVIGVAALAAGIHASSSAIATLLRQEKFGHLHQAGSADQVFLASFRTPAEDLILVTVFGEDSSIGMVRVFYESFTEQVASLPGWRHVRPTADAAAFEQDLEAGLDHFFGSL